MEKALDIVVLIAAVAVIVFILTYWKLDKLRYRVLAYLRYLDADLMDWLDAAAPLFDLEPAADRKEQYLQLAGTFRSTNKRKSEEKLSLANSIYDLVFNAALSCAGDPEARAVCTSLELMAHGFSGLAAEYNQGVDQLARELQVGLTGLVGRIMRVKKLERLAKLTELPGK